MAILTGRGRRFSTLMGKAWRSLPGERGDPQSAAILKRLPFFQEPNKVLASWLDFLEVRKPDNTALPAFREILLCSFRIPLILMLANH